MVRPKTREFFLLRPRRYFPYEAFLVPVSLEGRERTYIVSVRHKGSGEVWALYVTSQPEKARAFLDRLQADMELLDVKDFERRWMKRP